MSTESSSTPVAVTEVEPVQTPATQPTVIETLTAKHAEEMAAMQVKLDRAQINKAVEASKITPSTPLGNGLEDARRYQAIQSVGGNARWHALSSQQREVALGVTDKFTDDEIKQVFGHTSNSADASRLATMNPRKYAQMRKAAIERNLY